MSQKATLSCSFDVCVVLFLRQGLNLNPGQSNLNSLCGLGRTPFLCLFCARITGIRCENYETKIIKQPFLHYPRLREKI